MVVVLASDSHESEEFKQVWLDVLEAAGCNVLTRLPPRRRKTWYTVVHFIISIVIIIITIINNYDYMLMIDICW